MLKMAIFIVFIAEDGHLQGGKGYWPENTSTFAAHLVATHDVRRRRQLAAGDAGYHRKDRGGDGLH